MDKARDTDTILNMVHNLIEICHVIYAMIMFWIAVKQARAIKHVKTIEEKMKESVEITREMTLHLKDAPPSENSPDPPTSSSSDSSSSSSSDSSTSSSSDSSTSSFSDFSSSS
ncbi:suppressor protein SRP40-like [Silurus meridionalis]|uniref:suppressor protein SRP40-like n=1 Tax=Silurus meridionalis TaxID=175797 RepID=UPI001EEC5E7B|nr:suppressor protein SRP40-like [Silurus meridionalis]